MIGFLVSVIALVSVVTLTIVAFKKTNTIQMSIDTNMKDLVSQFNAKHDMQFDFDKTKNSNLANINNNLSDIKKNYLLKEDANKFLSSKSLQVSDKLTTTSNAVVINNMTFTKELNPQYTDPQIANTPNALILSAPSKQFTIKDDLSVQNLDIADSITAKNLEARESIMAASSKITKEGNIITKQAELTDAKSRSTISTGISTITKDTINTPALAIGTKQPQHALHLETQSAPNDWQLYLHNNNRWVAANHGDGYGLHINTNDQSSDKYALKLANTMQVANNGNLTINTEFNQNNIKTTPTQVDINTRNQDPSNYALKVNTNQQEILGVYNNATIKAPNSTFTPTNISITAPSIDIGTIKNKQLNITTATAPSVTSQLTVEASTLQTSDSSQFSTINAQFPSVATKICLGNTCITEKQMQSLKSTAKTPVDCQFGPWREEGQCSKPCGTGQQKFVRNIVQQEVNGGKACNATATTQTIKYEPCNTQQCPIDCQVSAWSQWTPCSKTCGTGTQLRTRSITQQKQYGGKDCPPLSESQPCNTQSCPQDCTFSAWTPWSQCTKACGTGQMVRTRTKLTDAKYGGACGVTSETAACNTQSCAVNCQVGGWSGWSPCSANCGSGTQTRTRGITVQPQNGGARCPNLSESISCQGECRPPVIGMRWQFGQTGTNWNQNQIWMSRYGRINATYRVANKPYMQPAVPANMTMQVANNTYSAPDIGVQLSGYYKGWLILQRNDGGGWYDVGSHWLDGTNNFTVYRNNETGA